MKSWMNCGRSVFDYLPMANSVDEDECQEEEEWMSCPVDEMLLR